MHSNLLLQLVLALLLIALSACSPAPLASMPAAVQIPTTALPVSATSTPQPTQTPAASPTPSAFVLTSPQVGADGALPVEYTCDGASSTLALAWSNPPAGTQSFALIMHHEASPTDIHWYWVVYDIPAQVTSLPKNMSGIGLLGTNSVNRRQAYTPPCSKGPGPKTYIYTLYALSSQPQLTVPAASVNRAVLLEAIRDITLASAELRVVYSRQ